MSEICNMDQISEIKSPNSTSISSSLLMSDNSLNNSECTIKYLDLSGSRNAIQNKSYTQKQQYESYCNQFCKNYEPQISHSNQEIIQPVQSITEDYRLNTNESSQIEIEQQPCQLGTSSLDWIKPYLNNEIVLQKLNLNQKTKENNNFGADSLIQFLQKEQFFQVLTPPINCQQSQSNQDNSFPSNYYDHQEVKEKIMKKLFKNNSQQSKNYSKIFITILIRFFKNHGIKNLCVPQNLKSELLQMVENCRKSSRIIDGNKIQRSDMFSKLHYGVLFLKINKNNLKWICINQKLSKLHQSILGLNLDDLLNTQQQSNLKHKMINKSKKILKQKSFTQQKQCSFKCVQDKKNEKIYQIEIVQQNGVILKQYANINMMRNQEIQTPCTEDDIQYYNFLKECLYQILFQQLQNILIDNKSRNNVENNSSTQKQQQYLQKIFTGISHLNQGVIVKKF